MPRVYYPVVQFGCLAVGYNLGVWTLVSLASILILNLSMLPDPGLKTAPITGLAWQESSDDLPLGPQVRHRDPRCGLPVPSQLQPEEDGHVEGPCNKGLEYVN